MRCGAVTVAAAAAGPLTGTAGGPALLQEAKASGGVVDISLAWIVLEFPADPLQASAEGVCAFVGGRSCQQQSPSEGIQGKGRSPLDAYRVAGKGRRVNLQADGTAIGVACCETPHGMPNMPVQPIAQGKVHPTYLGDRGPTRMRLCRRHGEQSRRAPFPPPRSPCC